MSDIKPSNRPPKPVTLVHWLLTTIHREHLIRSQDRCELHLAITQECCIAGQADTTSMTSRTEYSTQTPNKPSLFDVQYLRNHPTLDIGVLGYIGIVWPKEHSPEVRSFPPGTPCISRQVILCSLLSTIMLMFYLLTLGHHAMDSCIKMGLITTV